MDITNQHVANWASMTNKYEARWDSLTDEQRAKIVACLRTFKTLKPGLLAQVKELHGKDPDKWWAPFHFHTGMQIRNFLRDNSGIEESDLPVPNWDEYYIRGLEHAAGCFDDPEETDT